MANDPQTVDIEDEPVLLRFFEEVRASGEPLLVTHDGEKLVIVSPAEQFVPSEGDNQPKEKTEADLKRFLATAGGWRGKLDIEEFKRHNAERRRGAGGWQHRSPSRSDDAGGG